MKAGTKVGALACAIALMVALAAAPAQAGQAAPGGDTAAKRAKCGLSISEQRNLGIGGSYITSLRTKRMGCSKAKKLVSKFHKCRKSNGGRDGKCKRFKGWRCKQRITSSSPALYNAKAKCKKGARKFVQTYTQST